MQLAFDERCAFQPHRAAGRERSADRAERGDDLQRQGGVGITDDAHEAGAGERRHFHGELGAVGPARRAGAGEDPEAALIVGGLKLHEGRAGEFEAEQRDGLSRVGRGPRRIGRRADGGDGLEAIEADEHGEGREEGTGDLGGAARGGDADGALDGQRGGDGAVEVVLRAGHVEVAEIREGVDEGLVTDLDGASAFLEAGALQGEGADGAGPAAGGQRRRHQSRHDLQRHAGQGAEALAEAEGLAEDGRAFGEDGEDVGAAHDSGALPGVEDIKVEGEEVGLAGVETGEGEDLALVAEAAGEATEDHGALGAGTQPLGARTGLESVLEDEGVGSAGAGDADVIEAPGFVADALQTTVGKCQAHGGGDRGEGDDDIAIEGVGGAAEAEVTRRGGEAHVAGGGQAGHEDLGAGARGVESIDADDGDGGGGDTDDSRAIAGGEEHLLAWAEVGADEVKDLADVGGSDGGIGRGAAGGHARDRRKGGRAVGRRHIKPVHDAPQGAGPQGGGVDEGEAGEFAGGDALRSDVHGA